MGRHEHERALDQRHGWGHCQLRGELAIALLPFSSPAGVTTAHNILSTTHGDTLTGTVVRGDVIVGNSTPAWARVALGGSGTVLRSNGTDPSWSAIQVGDLPAHNVLSATHGDTLTGTVVRGDVIVGNSTPKWARLALGGSATFLRSNATDASWSAIGVGDLPAHNILSATHGDTVAATVVRGDVIVGNSTPAWARLPLGGSALVLRSNGTDATWAAVNLATDVTGTLGVGNGGTGTATTFTAGSVIFAGASGVYSQDNAKLFWDDTNFRLGIGTATPGFNVHVVSSGADAVVMVDAYGTGFAPNLQMRFARGTAALPTAVQNGDDIFIFGARGYGATGFASSSRSKINVSASENWTDTAQGCNMQFATTKIGTTTRTTALVILDNGNLQITDAFNIVVGTTNGTKIGTVGGAAGQKLGFFNATPIVQPLLATGAAHTVDDVITTLQNLGLCRQS